MVEEISVGYTRVTEVLGMFSGFENIPKHILDKACDRGSYVHSICEAIILGLGLGDIDELYQGYINSFKLWYESQKGKKIIIPERFYDNESRITGLCDCIVLDGNDATIVDFKTPLLYSRTWGLQCGAYSYMCEKIHPYKVTGVSVVQLDKYGSAPKIHDFSGNGLKNQTLLFMICLDMYRFFKKNEPIKSIVKNINQLMFISECEEELCTES